MQLILPSLIAFDTSHLNGWSRDRSGGRSQREKAKAFGEALVERGLVPLFSWHHFEEQIAHDNEIVVRSRLELIQSLPFVAWIKSGEPGLPGSIVALLSYEIEAAQSDTSRSLLGVRDLAARNAIEYGSGYDLIQDDQDFWLLLQRQIKSDAARRASQAAVIGSSTPSLPTQMTLGQLLGGKIRSQTERAAFFQRMRDELTDQIAKRRDKNARPANELADEFVNEVTQLGEKAGASVKDLVVGTLLRGGITPGELTMEARVSDLLDLIQFRQEAKVATRMISRRSPAIDHVTMDNIPTWRIRASVRRYGQSLETSPGGDINDAYLGCLACYAKIATVDKRTHENLRRVRAKDPSVAALLGTIVKASHYGQALPLDLA